MYVWVLTGQSESGDSYGPLVYLKKPRKKVLRILAHDWDGPDEDDERGEGPGDFGSYVYLTLEKIKVEE